MALRLAEIEKKSKRYPTDLTDAEWLAIEPLLPRQGKTGQFWTRQRALGIS